MKNESLIRVMTPIIEQRFSDVAGLLTEYFSQFTPHALKPNKEFESKIDEINKLSQEQFEDNHGVLVDELLNRLLEKTKITMNGFPAVVRTEFYRDFDICKKVKSKYRLKLDYKYEIHSNDPFSSSLKKSAPAAGLGVLLVLLHAPLPISLLTAAGAMVSIHSMVYPKEQEKAFDIVRREIVRCVEEAKQSCLKQMVSAELYYEEVFQEFISQKKNTLVSNTTKGHGHA